MGGTSSIFGSKDGPEQKTQTYTSRMNKQQKQYFKPLLDLYGSQIGKSNVYGGDRVADFSNLQKSVFDFADNGGFVTTPEQTREYFNSVYRDPMQKAYAESTLPAIKEAYGGPGYWGSNRANAEIKANKDLNDALNTQWGNLNWDVREANKAGAQTQFNLGQAQQQQQQNLINARMQKFAEDNQLMDPQNLQILMNLLGLNVNSTATSSNVVTIPSYHTSDWLELGAKLGSLFLP